MERQDLYEITAILKEGSDTAVIEKIISEHSSEITKTSDLQVKQFAYPIGKLTSGHYFAVEFVTDTAKITEIEKDLKAEKSIIRFLTTKAIRKGPEPIRTGEYAKENKEESQAETAEISQEEKVEAPLEPETIEEPVEEPVIEESEVKEETAGEEIVEETPEEEKTEEPEIQEETEEPVAEAPAEEQPKEEKLVTKRPRAKAAKVSADELDKKLEELVKE